MNAINRGAGPARLHAQPGHARLRQRRSAPPADVVAGLPKVAGFDLIVVETSGIGQGDAAIVPMVDVPMYVMTPGSAPPASWRRSTCWTSPSSWPSTSSTAKARRRALRDVAKQVQRNAKALGRRPEMPVFGTMASRFNDDGVTALYQARKARLAGRLTAGGLNGQPAARACATARTRPRSCRRARALPGRHRRHRCGYKAPRCSERAGARRSSNCAPPHACCRPATRDARRTPCATWPTSAGEASSDPGAKSCWPVAGMQGLRRRRVRGEDPRQGKSAPAPAPPRCPAPRSQGGLPLPTKTTARSCVADAGQRARQLPVHRRHLRLQA